MIKCTDGTGEKFAWMRPGSVQQMATCHVPGLSLMLYDLTSKDNAWGVANLHTLDVKNCYLRLIRKT